MTRKKARAILAAILVALALPALAQAAMADGEVRKVDKENQKITLKHGEIRNLDMPPMTMVFGVSDPKLLDKVRAGDKVRFEATDEGGGKLTITAIEAATQGSR
ncbi:MAG: hypothetical protein JWQ76_2586 [Ramlibacter sp.]|nr:hypothetical protein [Ramlibacter sp.]